MEDRLVPAPIAWTCNDGDWATPGCWDLNRLPGAGDDVTIDRPGTVTVFHPVGTDAVNSLTSQEALVLSGGLLQVNAAANLHGPFTLSGGTLLGPGTVTFHSLFTWVGGNLNALGAPVSRFVAHGGINLLSTAIRRVFEATLENHGTAVVSESAFLDFGPRTSFLNAETGLWRVEPGVRLTVAGSSAFRNLGWLHVRGELVVQNQTAFTSPGYTQIEGTLRSAQGAALGSGFYHLESGALLGLGGLSTGHAVWGAGSLTLSADVVPVRGVIAYTGTLRLGAALGVQLTSATVAVNGPITFEGANQLTLDNSLIVAHSLAVPANRSVTLTNGSGIYTQAGDYQNAGALTVAADSWVYTDGSYLQQGAAGAITTLNGGYLGASGEVAIHAGLLRGTGAIDGTLRNRSQVEVGTTQGTGLLVVTGAYVQEAAALLTMKLGGTTFGAYDQLYVVGQATLAGQLTVRLFRNYEPQLGDAFALLGAATLNSSRFAGLNLPLLGAGLQLTPVYDDTSLSLFTTATRPSPGGFLGGFDWLDDVRAWLVRGREPNSRHDARAACSCTHRSGTSLARGTTTPVTLP